MNMPMRQKVESGPYIVSFGDGCKARQRRETAKRIISLERKGIGEATFQSSPGMFLVERLAWDGTRLASVHDVLECASTPRA